MSGEPEISRPLRPLATISAAYVRGTREAHGMYTFTSSGAAERYPHVSQPHYTLPDGNLDNIKPSCRSSAWKRFVIVQPSFYGTDNSCLLDTL